VRLNLVGPLAAVEMQADVAEEAAAAAAVAAQRGVANAASSVAKRGAATHRET